MSFTMMRCLNLKTTSTNGLQQTLQRIASTIVVEDINQELHNDEMFDPQENFNKWPSTNTSMNSFNN